MIQPLPVAAAASVAIAVAVVLLSSGSPPAQTVTQTVTASALLATTSPAALPQTSPSTVPGPPAPQAPPQQPQSVRNPVGQLIIGNFPGTTPTPTILDAVRNGSIGGVILFASNTAGGPAATAALVRALQNAAKQGGNPGLLIMTDQEGGQVRRLAGPPTFSASEMADPSLASEQGSATAQLLSSAGVNVDLAPVADVSRVDGFLAREQRTFGSTPSVVANAACAFTQGLASGGVAYTLKHFPGLGDAVSSTDNGPVDVMESASLLHDDAAAYQKCGSGPTALVMVSSASYANLTGSTPAVLSPTIYNSVMPNDGIDAVTISDDFSAPAIAAEANPARRAINAGLDLVLYAQNESSALSASQQLSQDLQDGLLNRARVDDAVNKVLALKQNLNLS